MAKALITGAGSGIGAALAKLFSEKGYEVILVARREDRLRKVAQEIKGKSEIVTADLCSIESVQRIVQDHSDIDVLVNNAGMGVYGEFRKTDFSRESEMIDVNIRALHYLMKAYIPIMEKRGGGKILNIASSAAFFSGPLLSSYYATKAYVLKLSRAVSEELRRSSSPVKITAVCPGPVKTEFGKVSGSNIGKGAVSAEYVAKAAFEGMLKGKTVVTPTIGVKLTRFLAKILPEAVSVRIVYSIQRKKSL